MHNDYYIIPLKTLRNAALILAVAVISTIAIISSVTAETTKAPLPFSLDGRINIVHHFGGDVLYCVDENYVPTNTFFTDDTGGFQVLNMTGDLIWFVPAATILDAVEQAQPGSGNVLVAEGNGTHGPAALYTYKMTDGTVQFIYVGVDEHGKANQIDFTECIPVFPPVSGDSSGGSGICSEDELLSAVYDEDGDRVIQCIIGVFNACGFTPSNPPSDIDDIESCFCSHYPGICSMISSSGPLE